MSKKKFDSAADRQKAYRERKQLGDEGPLGDLVVEVDPAVPPGVVLLREGDEIVGRIENLGVRTPQVTLEDYVRNAIAGARQHHAQQSPDARDSTKELEVRIARAEAYARWRYKGFMAGEIASL